eukprot:scaffold95767_cov35-Prasinocladus_malaysianus.AAC.2
MKHHLTAVASSSSAKDTLQVISPNFALVTYGTYYSWISSTCTNAGTGQARGIIAFLFVLMGNEELMSCLARKVVASCTVAEDQ